MPSYVRAGIRKCARIRALSFPMGMNGKLMQEPNENTYEYVKIHKGLPANAEGPM